MRQSRHNQRGQESDDAYDDEEFGERECAAMVHGLLNTVIGLYDSFGEFVNTFWRRCGHRARKNDF